MARFQPSPEETEKRNRIRLSVFAYAYEVHDVSLISDADFDTLSLRIDPTVKTGHAVLDEFFATQFDPSTGMWVLQHPDQAGLEKACSASAPMAQKRGCG
ncbi:hypothetical protein EOE18_14705 [Novosphingobium umbonatum]|uniref:Uncharacterized protein n=1 Tax=Novosphingobium umbonatum TaxID=1908524 RepID=A0A437N0V5_9SPHN|nr:hypothetical protein [Novosphingobium umbonatum]RVU03570.1 hypothetical protein EOE18_14705 [Novosphingobium umbonatum]